MPNYIFDLLLIFGRKFKNSGQFEDLGETNLLVSIFFHLNAHVFEFSTNYQHKTQISVRHPEEKTN